MPVDLVALAETLTASPWFYVVLFTAVAVDAVVPLVPGEVLLTIGGSFIATDSWTGFLTVVAVGAAGALTGDLLSYRIGLVGRRLTRRLTPGGRISSLVRTITELLHHRGTAVLLGARFIPGCRTAATLAAGCARYPLPRFAMTCLGSSIGWSAYTVTLGYAGGAGFESNPLIGTAVGIALGLVVAGVLHIVASNVRLGAVARAE